MTRAKFLSVRPIFRVVDTGFASQGCERLRNPGNQFLTRSGPVGSASQQASNGLQALRKPCTTTPKTGSQTGGDHLPSRPSL